MGAIDTAAPLSRTSAIEARGLLRELLLASRTEVGDVQHEPAHVARLRLHCQARQILKRLQHLAVRADKALHVLVRAVGDDGHLGSPGLHGDVDVAVHVEDVQQLLEEVGGDVALVFEGLAGFVSHGRP